MHLRDFSRQDAELLCGQDTDLARELFARLVEQLGPSIDATIRQALSDDGWSHDSIAEFVRQSRPRIWGEVWRARKRLGSVSSLVDRVYDIAAGVIGYMIELACEELVDYVLHNGCSRTQRRNILSEALQQLTDKQRSVIEVRMNSEETDWAATAAANPECGYFDEASPHLQLDNAAIKERQNALRVAWSRARPRFVAVLRGTLFP